MKDSKRTVGRLALKMSFLFWALLIMMATCGPVAAAQTIVVAYNPEDAFVEKKSDGSLGGYGIDYLQELQKYGDMTFEYTPLSWADSLSGINAKTVDVVVPAHYTPEWAEAYAYSKFEAGTLESLLYTKEDSDIYYEDYTHLNGQTIGFVEGSVTQETFKAYSDAHGFSYETKTYPNDEALNAALDSGEIVALATDDLAPHLGLQMVCRFDCDPYYFMGAKDSTTMAAMDEAMAQLKTQEPEFTAALFEKYFGNNREGEAISFTREEIAYIQAAPTLKVGVNSGIKPMAYTDDQGNLVGITPALLDWIAQKCGLHFEYYPLEGRSDAYTYDYFREKGVDLLSGVESNEFTRITKGLTLTNTYFKTTKVMIGRSGEDYTDSIDSIAIVGGSGTLPLLLAKEYPSAQVKTYETIEDCLKAVVERDADVLLYNQYLVEQQLARPQYTGLTILHGYSLEENLALSPVNYLEDNPEKKALLNDPRLVSILNKTIDYMSTATEEQIIMENTVGVSKAFSFSDYLYTYRIPIILLAMLFVAVLILLIQLNASKKKTLAFELERNTQLAEAMNQAEDANNAKSQFLARMSHDIRTPMNAIIGITDIARSHSHEPERVEDYLDKIKGSSKLLLGLINDVLDMSAIESDKLRIANAPFDLKEILLGLNNTYYLQCKEKGIDYEMVLKDVCHERLKGDALRVNQILFNLLSNAIKFTPSGGTIRVCVSQTSETEDTAYMRFVVSDTGVGMSEAMKERLFKPFEQEDATTAQKYGGTGLGLSIVKRLVELMHGAITVDTAKEKGTTFTVDLPFSLADEDTIDLGAEGKNRKALIVDDQLEAREYMKAVLDRMQLSYDVAESVDGAEHLLRKAVEAHTSYDLCFVDWQMPQKDGLVLVKLIRRYLGEAVCIVVLSAYDMSCIESEASAAGADYILTKPIFQSTIFNLLVTMEGKDKTVESGNPEDYDFTGHRVLLAEDNEINTEIAVTFLEMAKVTVDAVENGKAALEAFAQSAPGTYAMILMDVQMPIMNGYEAVGAIRRLNRPDAKTIPIYAMTANAFTEDVTASLAAGMNGHISKPIDTAVLYRVLKENIE